MSVRCCLAAAFILSAVACHAKLDTSVVRQTIRIAGLTERNTDFFEALAASYGRALPDVDFRLVASSSEGSIEALRRGQVHVAIALADQTYTAYLGKGDGDARDDSLRGMALLWLARIQILARPRSGVGTISDLRGRRLGLAWNASTVRLVLMAFGVSPSEVDINVFPPSDATRQLLAGRLDAIVVGVGLADPQVQNAVLAGARLIPIDGDPATQLHRDYPFLHLTTIPAGSYPGLFRSVHTIGVPALLMCGRDLAEPLVHDLTRVFVEFLLSASVRVPFFDLRSAPATPIPLHDGARRYYRELELLR